MCGEISSIQLLSDYRQLIKKQREGDLCRSKGLLLPSLLIETRLAGLLPTSCDVDISQTRRDERNNIVEMN